MAVMRNSIIFGGVDSADYGIYIGGEGTFNAPKRDVEMISIPGRNGAFALDKGRFENIEVTYSAFNYETDLATFAQNLSDFRNAICSQKGYQRLTDTFHTDEYRMAAYISGLEIKPIDYNTASKFDIVFDCKPQRFLTSGEEPVTIGEWGDTETASGTIASFEAVEGDGVKSLVVDIEPYQSGSGTPSPDNVRPISGYGSVEVWGDPKYGGTIEWNQLQKNTLSRTNNGVTFTYNNGALTITGTATASAYWLYNSDDLKWDIIKDHVYLCDVGNNSYTYEASGAYWYIPSGFSTSAITAPIVIKKANSTVRANMQFAVLYGVAMNATYKPQIFDLTQMFGAGNEPTTVEEFTALFPKDYYAYNAGTSTCVSAVNGDPYNHYTTSLSGTRYGGTLDVVSGILTVDTLKLTFDGTEDWRAYNGFYYVATGESGGNPQEMLCNAFDWKGTQTPATPQIGDFWAGYTGGGIWTGNICFKYDDGSNLNAFKTYIASIPLEVTYKIEPVTYEVSQPMSYIQLETGTNNFWADTGDITVEYGTIPYKVYNPTLFEARPMLEVEGYGNINIGGETVTLNDEEVGNTVIADALVQNWPTRTSLTYAFDIDVSMLNEGDIITVPPVALEYSYAINDGYTNVRASVDHPHNTTGATNASGTTQKITLDAGSFAYKTAGSYDGSVWFDTSWNGPNADTYEMQRMTRVSYDGEHTITLASIGGNADEECYTRTGTKWIIPTIYGNSTKMISSIVDKAYIDLDVGEAYFVDDGTVVSLNNVTALPAVLPTLKPSVNEITFDNTVTELKVVPRWWKV